MSKIETFAIVGAGAIGGYYGARLALAGADVRFLLRSELAHVRAHGLTLRERDATRRVERVAAFGTIGEIGPVDVVLVTLKSTANAALPALLPPLLGPNTVVVTLQNGLGNEELIASLIGAERVLGGLCFIAVTREGTGELVGYHTPGALTLGEFGRPAAERTRAIAQWFVRAGVNCRVTDNLAEARWRKLLWNVSFNGLAIAGGGITTDRILADATLAREVRALMDEIAAAARHFGYSIPEEFIQSQIDITPPMGAYKPSSLVDFLAGREVEVEAIWGEPLRRAQAAGLPMPRLAALYAKLHGVAEL
ncbi:MAG TPA: 2-dehydropantoate 2-reductase [Opitutaceae bacterium]|nr:2-dehydropantoate 2-reductase [Opitutaceae bacterium]